MSFFKPPHDVLQKRLVLSGGVAQLCPVEINQSLNFQQAGDIGTPHLAAAFACGEMIAKRPDLMMMLGWKHTRVVGHRFADPEIHVQAFQLLAMNLPVPIQRNHFILQLPAALFPVGSF